MNASNRIAIVVHGGAGASLSDIDGCQHAAQQGFRKLTNGSDALAAAIEAVVALEKDGRFNAGVGAALGLDGRTMEMDASVMDTRGTLGAVTCVRNVRHPVLLARAIADSPSWLLCGEGAQRFADAKGLAHHPGPGDKAQKDHAEVLEKLEGEEEVIPGEPNEQFARLWNYATARKFRCKSVCDTVGAVVRDAQGHFAVAGSTGGSAPSLLGRVGDTPIMGSGFYAGEHGAVAASGIGEEIVRNMLAFTVYRWIADGTALQEALRRGVDLFDPEVAVGLIAVTHTESGWATNGEMPTAEMERG